MTQVHPRINIGLQYIRNTNEIHFEVIYTSTLPLNQEGILSTQFSSQLFFSVSFGSSSSPRHIQVFFIFKSSSSSIHIHHWIWIITRSGSSLDIIIGSRSSLLDLDHHLIQISRSHHNQIWIIARSRYPLVIIICSIS